MLDWLGLPVAGAAHAGRIDQILGLVHWLMLVLFVGWSGFFVYVLVRFRRRANPVASYHGVTGQWTTWLEAGVLAAEVILLAFFSIPAWSARVDAFPAENESIIVRVVAEQFAWNIHYPGNDRRFGRTAARLISPDNPLGLDTTDPAAQDDVTTINELHLPVGRTAILYLSSKDVIHSFTLPEMRVKQDTIPGTIQPTWFTPTRTGEWEIACSQLCGLAHYRMRGFFVVQSADDYSAWLQEVAAENAPTP